MFRHVTTRFAGLIILIAGVWGGLIPFLGPTFHFTLGVDTAWHWDNARLWLSVLPAAAAVLGGLILMGGGPRLSGRFGALLALAGGVWFAVGPDVSLLWNHGVSAVGAPHGSHAITRMLEYLTLHSGIGVLITALAAYSLPGVSLVEHRHVAEDAAMGGAGAAAGAAAERHHRDRVAEREGEPVGAGTGTAGGARGAHRGERDAAIAGTGAAAGAAAEAHHRDREEEREGEPVADRTATQEPVAERGANEPAGSGTAAEPAGNGGAQDTAAADQQAGNQQTGTTRRRGGLAGLFSRD